jgi:hypothetical protein
LDAFIKNEDYSKKREFKYGLISDIHDGDKNFARKIFKRKMDQLVSMNARIFVGGDNSSLILYNDPRFTPQKVDEDLAVRDAAINYIADRISELLLPYVNYIDIICPGNHEATAVRHYHADALHWAVRDLNRKRDKSLPPIRYGGYSGFIGLMFRKGEHRSTKTFTLFYHHGKGGDARKTKGMLDLDQARTKFRADLYWIQHKHKSITDTGMCETGLNYRTQRIYTKKQGGVVTGAFKTPTIQTDFNKHGYSDLWEERSFYGSEFPGHTILCIEFKNNQFDWYLRGF